MHIAYIISAYKYPEQLVRLVQRLNAEATTFMIHVDKKSDAAMHQRAAAGLARLPNVHFLEPHVCHWGDFGHVRASLKGLRALRQQGSPFEAVVLLTGQDYPIKPNAYIRRFLQQHAGTSFLEHWPLPWQSWANERGGLDRLEYWHYQHGAQTRRFPPRWLSFWPLRRRLPRGLQPFGGSSYWILSRASADYVDDYVEQHPDYTRFFQRAYVPDESFFQTLLLNSPLAAQVTRNNFRFYEWQAASPSPKILDSGDYDKMARHHGLFARKFDLTVDSAILDRLDQSLLPDDNPAFRA